MASTLITCIDYVLNNLVSLVKRVSDRDAETLKLMRLELRSLKTFLLAARNDASLESFFSNVEDIVQGIADELPSSRHPHSNDPTNLDLSMVPEFQKEIQSLAEDIDEWLAAILDDMQQSTSLTIDEVKEVISSILENLVDLHSFKCTKDFHFEILEDAEALGEQMSFLKSLISFNQTSSNTREELLPHSKHVALSAARLLFECRVLDEFDEERCKEKQVQISTLLQKIKPIDPKVCETYIQVLDSSKLPKGQHEDDDAFIPVKSFLDSLISNLWEQLSLNTFPVVSIKDQLKELYEGLRSLRTMIKKEQELKIEDIRAVLCDTGVLICSLHQRDKVVHLGLQSLLERIKFILEKIGEKDPKEAISKFPRSQLSSVDILLDELADLICYGAEPTARNRLQIIHEKLSSLRDLLIVNLCDKQEELQRFILDLQPLWDRGLEVARRVKGLIDHLEDGNLLDSSSSSSLNSIAEDIGNLKADILYYFRDLRLGVEALEVTRNHSHMPPQRIRQIDPSTTDVVGFVKETDSMKDRLMRGSNELQIVPIVGMPGLGKTTLAGKVYNDASIMYRFPVRAWTTISQAMDKRKVLIELLNQIYPSGYSGMSEADLAEILRKNLKGKRYLIVLDDMWDIQAWNSLGMSFPSDKTGSRIIVTSRYQDVAPRYMFDKDPQILDPLNPKDSLKLLQIKLFPGNGWPTELHVLGEEIATSCKGLPLTLVIVAGLLKNSEPPEGWKGIRDSLISVGGTIGDHSTSILELSYKNLPPVLRPCLLYFGTFPEDQEISVRRLVRLWSAEGFARTQEMKRSEHVAERYLEDLIGRSLIMVSKQRSRGGVKSCRIHDLLHDFCLRKAKEIHHFHLLKKNDELSSFNEPRNFRRLCIHSEPEHLNEAKLFCPRANSLLINSSHQTTDKCEEEPVSRNISFMLQISKLLRVLDLEQIDLGSRFPTEIALLIQLVFLAIRGKMRHIPSWIGKLSNLETFIVVAGKEILPLPDSVWSLQKLKYVCIRSGSSDGVGGGGSLPIENLDNSSVLNELDGFAGAIIPYQDMKTLFQKFPELRKLKCKLSQFQFGAGSRNNIAELDFSSLLQLATLDMSFEDKRRRKFEFDLILPINLRKLTLSRMYLRRENLSTIGKLPNLEVLKLVLISFQEKTWEMQEGEFQKLRMLKLWSMDLVSWKASDDFSEPNHFQKLVLEGCIGLKELPSFLVYCPTLEMVEVAECSNTVVDLVKEIKITQEEYNNADFKIILGRSLEDQQSI